MLKAVTDPSTPSVSDRNGHGARPASFAAWAEQTSFATRQIPSRSLATIRRGTSGAPTAGAATTNSAAKRASAATYSIDA